MLSILPDLSRLLFPGSLGIAVSVGAFLILLFVFNRVTPEGPFDFGKDFQTQLAVYLDIAKFVLGLAAGGIVLIVSASTLRINAVVPGASPPRLPQAYASPMATLAMTIFYGVLFMAFLAYDFDVAKIDPNSYTRWKYVKNQTLGFSTLACFCIGYIWLVFAAVLS
jgi:hypothetical protein